MGSGTTDVPALTSALGKRIAADGYHLLTGAGAGVMAGVSRGFFECKKRLGLVIGIVPGSIDLERSPRYQPKTGYPNQWVELPIYTHLPLSGVQGQDTLSRNHINILSSDVIVVLPGGPGTASELELARRYGKTVFELNDLTQLDSLFARIHGALDALRK